MILKNRLKCIASGLALIFLVSTATPALAISIPSEKKLAGEFMAHIHDQGRLLNDPVVLHFIRTLGREITRELPPQPFDFNFYLIHDKTFNAFAAPGANIFIHTGLITALNNTNELAGILAHEIAHAASRHVSQSIDRAQLLSIGSMAGVLAGVLLGATGDGDAGQALTVGSLAAGQSNMLAFTRENETEADQKAVLYLRKTCYDPEGLLSSLSEMRSVDYQGIEGIPDYFKTHPGTGNRIAHLSALLAGEAPREEIPTCPKTHGYDMVKARVMALYANAKEGRTRLEALLKDKPGDPAVHYGLGMAYARINRRQAAIAHLQEALVQQPGDALIQVELGRVYAVDGQPQAARDYLLPLTSDPILGTMATYHLAVTRLDSGQLSLAEKDLTRLFDNKGGKTFPRAYYHMANIMAQRGKTGLSHYYLGIYYQEIREQKNAERHLNKALETLSDPDKKKEIKERLARYRPKRKK